MYEPVSILPLAVILDKLLKLNFPLIHWGFFGPNEGTSLYIPQKRMPENNVRFLNIC